MRWACHQSSLPQVIAPAPLWFAMAEVPIPGALMVLSEYPSEYLLFATPLYDALQLGPGEKRPARQVAPDHVSCEIRILLNRYIKFSVFRDRSRICP